MTPQDNALPIAMNPQGPVDCVSMDQDGFTINVTNIGFTPKYVFFDDAGCEAVLVPERSIEQRIQAILVDA